MDRYNEPERIPVCRVNKLFGTDGQVMVTLYDGFDPENNGGPIFVDIDGLSTPFFFNIISYRGKNKAVFSFDDLDNESRVSVLIGKELYLIAEPTEQHGAGTYRELYMEDLEGFTAILDSKSRMIQGKVIEYIGSEFNPLFNININGKEYLVPATHNLIESIDMDNHIVHIRISEGLLKLNC